MLNCLASGGTAVNFSDGYNNALATSGPVVFCVLRWWRVYQYLDGWTDVMVYCDWPISKVLFNPDDPEINDIQKL